MKKDDGSCANSEVSNYSVKWFFDIAHGDCVRFLYGGCDGNENRFETRDDCRLSCVHPPGILGLSASSSLMYIRVPGIFTAIFLFE